MAYHENLRIVRGLGKSPEDAAYDDALENLEMSSAALLARSKDLQQKAEDIAAEFSLPSLDSMKKNQSKLD